MPQVLTFPSSFTLRRPFEELPLVTLFTAKGEAMMTGLVSGEFEVTVSWHDGDWHFSDIWVAADNLKMGAEARGCLLNLDADVDERLFLTLLDALEARYTTSIEEWIEEEMMEEGIRRPAA